MILVEAILAVSSDVSPVGHWFNSGSEEGGSYLTTPNSQIIAFITARTRLLPRQLSGKHFSTCCSLGGCRKVCRRKSFFTVKF
jgi:hypothetical protein